LLGNGRIPHGNSLWQGRHRAPKLTKSDVIISAIPGPQLRVWLAQNEVANLVCDDPMRLDDGVGRVQGETPVQIPVVVEGSLLRLAGYMRHDVLHEPAVALDALGRP